MEVTRIKRYTYFVGVDVSKNELDFAVLQGAIILFHKEIKNERKEIEGFISELKSLPKFTIAKCVFCMENTGFYCNHLLLALKRVNANIVLENPLLLKKALGLVRGKDDKIDAIRIAQHAYRSKDNLRLWIPKRPIIHQLANLAALRLRLIEVQMGLKTPLQEQQSFIKKVLQKKGENLCSNSLKAIKADIQEVDAQILETINSDPQLKHLVKLITSVPSIGIVTAVQIIISSNEFRDINDPRKFACYAGIAPFPRESGGIVRKKRISQFANKKMKSLLHICAMGSTTSSPEIKAYYKRKTQVEGKPKMAVLNAIRNKLILRVFACVNQNRMFQKEYVRETVLQEVS